MIFNKEINSVKFTLFCESWTNRTSWGHKVTLYRNDSVVSSARVRYYNRTWEVYQYQSAIKCVIWNVIAELKELAKTAFKKLHGYKILTKKRAVEFAEYLTREQAYNMYNELYRMF